MCKHCIIKCFSDICDMTLPHETLFLSIALTRWDFGVNAMIYSASYLQRFSVLSPYYFHLFIYLSHYWNSNRSFRYGNIHQNESLRILYRILNNTTFSTQNGSQPCCSTSELCLGRLIVYAYSEAKAVKTKTIQPLKYWHDEFLYKRSSYATNNTCSELLSFANWAVCEWKFDSKESGS